MGAILVLNAGSSSIKFALYEPCAEGTLRPLARGQAAHTGAEMVLRAKDPGGAILTQQQWPLPAQGFDHDLAAAQVMRWLSDHLGGVPLAAVGHRVVHGGLAYASPVVVSNEVLEALDALVPLAPLHQPHNLKAIRLVAQRWPRLPQVACFDTAFHRTQPPVAQALALPRALSEAGLKRYGFHGLSYEYVATQLPRVLGPAAQGRVIVAHLGNGASLCGLIEGRSVTSTMGFSALDGLMMGTRCGTLDPGVVLYLLQHEGLDAQAISHLLYSQSGLLGVSGISSDMQTLLASRDDPRAQEALALFVYRIQGQIGQLAAAMGGLDALVFTAGIGEHAAPIRAQVAAACAWLGAELDEAANQAARTLIHAPSSRMQLAIVPTDEELMIATHVQHLLGL